MESTLKNMILTLLIITLTSALCVGLVYKATEKPIAKAKADKTLNALAEVLPEFDNDPATESSNATIEGADSKVYTAKKGDQVSGYAIETFSNNGFGGQIKLMVGFKPDGEIVKVVVLQHTETPGLGDKIEASKSDFSLQFAGKNPETFKLAVKKDGGNVDAITASTISSRAFTEAVDKSYKVLQEINKGGKANE